MCKPSCATAIELQRLKQENEELKAKYDNIRSQIIDEINKGYSESPSSMSSMLENLFDICYKTNKQP